MKDVHYNQNKRRYAGEVQISLKSVRLDRDPIGMPPYSFRRIRRRCVWDTILGWQSLTIIASLLILFTIGFFGLCVCSNSNCSEENGVIFANYDSWWYRFCCNFLCCCRCNTEQDRRPSSPRIIHFSQQAPRSARIECNHLRRGPPPPPPPQSSSTSLLTTTSSHPNHIGCNHRKTIFGNSYSYECPGSNPTQQSSSSAMSTGLDDYFYYNDITLTDQTININEYNLPLTDMEIINEELIQSKNNSILSELKREQLKNETKISSDECNNYQHYYHLYPPSPPPTPSHWLANEKSRSMSNYTINKNSQQTLTVMASLNTFHISKSAPNMNDSAKTDEIIASTKNNYQNYPFTFTYFTESSSKLSSTNDNIRNNNLNSINKKKPNLYWQTFCYFFIELLAIINRILINFVYLKYLLNSLINIACFIQQEQEQNNRRPIHSSGGRIRKHSTNIGFKPKTTRLSLVNKNQIRIHNQIEQTNINNQMNNDNSINHNLLNKNSFKEKYSEQILTDSVLIAEMKMNNSKQANYNESLILTMDSN